MKQPTASAATRPAPLLVRGTVRHRRLRPAVHRFGYPSCQLLLPMRRLRAHPAPGLARNRAGWLSFHDRDHGSGGPDALAWFEGLVAEAGLTGEVDGEVWLQTHPRVLGRVFKPVSFWYGHRADGSLALVLAEVNNTFGERHCYLLQGAGLGWGRDLRAAKVFHVSPFCRVQGEYVFRFMRTRERLVARIDLHDADGALLETSVSGRLDELSPALARAAFFAAPRMGLAVTWRIHWQALRLLVRRVPWFAKPAPPEALVSR